MKRKVEVLLLLVALVLVGCGDDPFPKPKGYFRLDLPPQRFRSYSGSCPLTAEVPVYALMTRHTRDSTASTDTACWVEMRFPFQHAEVFMTYRRIDHDLAELVQDAHAFKSKHEVKAARIRSERVLRDSARVFGNLFEVEGDVASPMVFYLTDSTTHFLYGSLYFNARPNADSLGPVTERIRSDLRHFAGTLNWR